MAWFLFYPFAVQASKVVFATTVIFNVFLIYLTISHTKRITGAYKYMIIIFAFVGILFVFMKATLHPYLHSHHAGIMFFSLEADWGRFKAVEVALMVYTGVYSAMISIVAIQFVFRYWTLFCEEKLKYFNTWRCIVWFLYVLLIGMGWSFMIYFCASSDHYSRSYMRECLFDTYGMDVEKTVGFFIVVYNNDKSIRWHNIAFIMGLLIDLMIQYIIVIFCGTRMNQKMEEKLSGFSLAHRRLQEQLFKTLVLQITIPSIIFHLPFVPVLCAPLLDLNFDFESGMIYCLFSLYPPIDSAILMFVVHDYRHAIIKVDREIRKVSDIQLLICNPHPGPTPLPLIGNIHQIAYQLWKTGGIVPAFQAIRKEHGEVFTLYMGPLPVVFIADYDVAHDTHVKKAHQFGTRFVMGGLEYIREGRGIIVSNGEFWKEHRRFALHTLRNFGLGRNIMEERIMEEFNYRVADFQKTNFKNGAIEVHAGSFFDLLVGSIINQLLVSERFEQDDQEFEKLKTNLALSLETGSLVEAFAPIWFLKSRLMRWRAKTVFAPFDFVLELSKKSIQKKVKAVESGEVTLDQDEQGADFVEAFLIKMEKDRADGVKDSTFKLETLAIDVYDLWLAGQETTSTTLTWACACLLNYPRVVKELRRELVQVTGGNRHVSLTDRPQTPYLNATVNEVQRIASILNVNLFRVMVEDTVIDGQPLASGTVVTTMMSMIHTDEELFKEHAEFRPERFLENNGLEKKLIPFGIGKRSCLGESLARAELYLILGNLTLNYDLEPMGEVPSIQSPVPFALLKRPPSFNIRFVPVSH